MNPGRSLFFKILLWFFMSLLLLVALVAGIFKLDFHLRPDSALIKGMGGQGKALGRVILQEIHDSSYYEWGTVLDRFGKAYDLELLLCRSNGQILAGPKRTIPQKVIQALGEVKNEFNARPRRPQHSPPNRPARILPPRRHGPPLGAARRDSGRTPRHLLPLPPPERLQFKYLLRTSGPSRYWAYVPLPFQEQRDIPPTNLFLLAASKSITGNGLFFNPAPWMLLAGFVLAASILLLIPLVKNITRPIGRITRAAEEIAKGNFDIHVEDQRKDEIGRLGAAINHMSGQLENHIMGQKRFLGDMAHELASPIARMELGISIFEQRLKGQDLDHLKDISEEVRHMSNLINELLSFTRAEIGPERLEAKAVPLKPVIGAILEREGAAHVKILNRVPEDISVWAVDSLLRRALSNILRNAVRYAGDAGPIDFTAQREDHKVLIRISDQGPGVPEASIQHLFEPFYRPEAVRSPESGGVGLGLAIVKACVQACKGTVLAENLKPKGFSISIILFSEKPKN
jgi:signal transduction histidine kinase